MGKTKRGKYMVHFEKVGRFKKTYDVALPSHIKPTLEALVEECSFMTREVRPYMVSTPRFELGATNNKIGVFAAHYCVGEVWLVKAK